MSSGQPAPSGQPDVKPAEPPTPADPELTPELPKPPETSAAPGDEGRFKRVAEGYNLWLELLTNSRGCSVLANGGADLDVLADKAKSLQAFALPIIGLASAIVLPAQFAIGKPPISNVASGLGVPLLLLVAFTFIALLFAIPYSVVRFVLRGEKYRRELTVKKASYALMLGIIPTLVVLAVPYFFYAMHAMPYWLAGFMLLAGGLAGVANTAICVKRCGSCWPDIVGVGVVSGLAVFGLTYAPALPWPWRTDMTIEGIRYPNSGTNDYVFYYAFQGRINGDVPKDLTLDLSYDVKPDVGPPMVSVYVFDSQESLGRALANPNFALREPGHVRIKFPANALAPQGKFVQASVGWTNPSSFEGKMKMQWSPSSAEVEVEPLGE